MKLIRLITLAAAGFIAGTTIAISAWATGETIVPEAGIRDLPGPEPTP